MAVVARTDDRFLFRVLVASGVLRMIATIATHPYVYVDSIDYETLDFSGGGRRPWVTPLLYDLASDPKLRTLLQAMIGAMAWIVLAVEVGQQARHRWAQRGATVAVLLLSLTTSITNWDNTILSESLALSTLAVFAACLLRFARLGGIRDAAFATIAALFWIFTRQNHLVLGLLITASVVVLAVVRWRRAGRTAATPVGALAAGLVVVSALAVTFYGQNTQIVHFNTAMVIGNRLLLEPDSIAWMQGHGMPALPEGITVGAPVNPEPLLADPAFRDWIEDDGVGTYARFLLTHPWTTFTQPLDDFVSDRKSFADPDYVDETMLSTAEAYSSARNVMPEPIEDILFDPGQTGTLLLVLVLTILLTADRWRRSGPDPRWTVPLLAIGLQWPALTVVWHASAAELGRLSLISAVGLRIGLVTQIALLADAWLLERVTATSVHVGGEGVADVAAEVDDGVDEPDGDGGGADDDGEPVAERRRR